ncbi:DUF6221 family protein [Dactylosporangium sp. AC04546]|uniref:DUF6221 family protein n=1 Tax=Dactylosporangium sp. AC04546 TaxID=2862460 RepID=UPI001EDEBA94|nr:DUF6221 family protein [Dactylosporangium sp. AC04546]WVK84223.1 DUF6221 family protein [Dactylosporangium sp. AC04546]
MTNDLVEFIEARLAEDESLAGIISAGAYAPQVWRVKPDQPGGWREIRAFDGTNFVGTSLAPDAGELVAVVPGGREQHVHITRHDPARIVREVAAKRRRLERHKPGYASGQVEYGQHHEVYRREDGKTIEVLVQDDEPRQPNWCRTCAEPAPCRELRNDASVWSDHPDYPEWAV